MRESDMKNEIFPYDKGHKRNVYIVLWEHRKIYKQLLMAKLVNCKGFGRSGHPCLIEETVSSVWIRMDIMGIQRHADKK